MQYSREQLNSVRPVSRGCNELIQKNLHSSLFHTQSHFTLKNKQKNKKTTTKEHRYPEAFMLDIGQNLYLYCHEITEKKPFLTSC